MAAKKQTGKRKGRKTRKTSLTLKEKLIFGLTLLAMAAGLFVSIGEDLGLPVNWDAIYKWFGVAGDPLPAGDLDSQANAIHFIDIGQGDATLLQSGGEYCLVDAGLAETKQQLFDYLDNLGVTHLKLLVMSHPHADHIGAMAEIIERYEVDQVLLPDFSKAPMPTSATFERVLDAIEKHSIPSVTAVEGQVYPIGSGSLTVLADGVKTDNLNNLSQVLYYEAGNLTAVLSGDAEKAAEKDALERGNLHSAKVFKAGHHGSRTSNTQAFLDVVAPRYVAISCGEGNKYGHPNEEPMERFQKIGAQILRTDLNGSIVIAEQDGMLQSYTSKGFEEAA